MIFSRNSRFCPSRPLPRAKFWAKSWSAVSLGIVFAFTSTSRADLRVNAYRGIITVPPNPPNGAPPVESIPFNHLPFIETLDQADVNQPPEEPGQSVAESRFNFDSTGSFTFFTGFHLEVAKSIGAYSKNEGSIRFSPLSPNGLTSFSYMGNADFSEAPYSSEYTLQLSDVTDDDNIVVLFNVVGNPSLNPYFEFDEAGNEDLLSDHIYELSYSFNAFLLAGSPGLPGNGDGSFTVKLHDATGIQIVTVPAPGAVMLAALGLVLAGRRKKRPA